MLFTCINDWMYVNVYTSHAPVLCNHLKLQVRILVLEIYYIQMSANEIVFVLNFILYFFSATTDLHKKLYVHEKNVMAPLPRFAHSHCYYFFLQVIFFFGLFPIWGRQIEFSSSTFSSLVLRLSVLLYHSYISAYLTSVLV